MHHSFGNKMWLKWWTSLKSFKLPKRDEPWNYPRSFSEAVKRDSLNCQKKTFGRFFKMLQQVFTGSHCKDINVFFKDIRAPNFFICSRKGLSALVSRTIFFIDIILIIRGIQNICLDIALLTWSTSSTYKIRVLQSGHVFSFIDIEFRIPGEKDQFI